MKKILLYLICIWCGISMKAQDIRLLDSLETVFGQTLKPDKRIALLINMFDLAESTPNELTYAYQLYKEAMEAGDGFALATPLGTITSHLLETGKEDSLEYYLNGADRILKDTPYDGLTDYYRMTSKARALQISKRENRAEICERYAGELELLRKRGETPYQSAERLFLIGVITYQLMSLTEKADWTKGVTYWEEAWEIVQTFPLLARKNFSGNLCICLLSSYRYTEENIKAIGVANTYLSNLDAYYNQEEVRVRRPYINKDVSYAICYQQLILNEGVVGKEKAHEYYLRYCDFMNKKRGDALLRNKTFFYDISCKHYLSRKDYGKALAYKDSIIMLIEKGGSLAASKTEHYKGRADILHRWGKYEEACEAYAQAIRMQDTLIEQEYVGKVSEMRVKHDVDKLELANITLLAEKRKTTLYFAFCFIVIAIVISVYLYLNLKKVTRLQKELVRESARAQESENMKTAFINSMCHEVRTPLNAICGFSELIVDDTMTPEEKASFPEIIQTNTQMLISLMNDLLEVANLDSTSNIFPLEDTDVILLCKTEMDRLRGSNGKQGIEYRLRFPQEVLLMHTNAKYFSLMIRSLLDNANKFTERGHIMLECRLNDDKSEATFIISDTGCGISSEKYDYIFERFSKIDSFTQGTGLGLYICKIIVERMNGRIFIDPDYKDGAKFVVIVPLASK